MHETSGNGAIKFWIVATIGAAVPLALAWRNAQHHVAEEDEEERPPFKALNFILNRTRVRYSYCYLCCYTVYIKYSTLLYSAVL